MTMKLHHTTASPFVRKVMVTAIEAGLDDELNLVTPPSTVWVGDSPAALLADNPLGKIPTLITRDDVAMIESSLICEYLASLNPDAGLLPAAGTEHWRVRNLQAQTQGLMDAIVLGRVEGMMRAPELRSKDILARQAGRVTRVLDLVEGLAGAGDFGEHASRVDLGTITLGCAIGFSVDRIGDQSWREGRPTLAAWYDDFSQRPSMLATIPPETPSSDSRQGGYR